MVTIDVNSQPYSLAEGSWDELRDQVADRAIAKLERYFPGLTQSITARQVLAPTDLESLLGICGRPRASRRHGVRPALQPASGPRMGRVPHAGRRALALRRRHPPRRRRDRCQRAQLRPRGHPRSTTARAAMGGAPMSPLWPNSWDQIAAPAMVVDPPGPRSQEILDRIAAGAYPGLSTGLAPMAIAEKRAWTVADVDGNVYLDCASASASVPLGAGRPEVLKAAIDGAQDLRQRGLARARLGTDGRARREAARDQPGEHHPLRHRPQRHRGGRDRDQDDAPRDGTAGDPRLPRLLPRRVHADRRPWRRVRRDRPRPSRARPRVRPRPVSESLPLAVSRPATRRHRRRDGRLPPRPRPLPRARPVRGRRGHDRAGARLGRMHQAAGLVLAGARRPLRRARLAALRRRGQDRLRPLGQAARGRALGPSARPDLPRQGAGRRRDADWSAARVRAGDGRLRRRPDRQHLGLAAGSLCSGAGDD